MNNIEKISLDSIGSIKDFNSFCQVLEDRLARFYEESENESDDSLRSSFYNVSALSVKMILDDIYNRYEFI